MPYGLLHVPGMLMLQGQQHQEQQTRAAQHITGRQQGPIRPVTKGPGQPIHLPITGAAIREVPIHVLQQQQIPGVLIPGLPRIVIHGIPIPGLRQTATPGVIIHVLQGRQILTTGLRDPAVPTADRHPQGAPIVHPLEAAVATAALHARQVAEATALLQGRAAAAATALPQDRAAAAAATALPQDRAQAQAQAADLRARLAELAAEGKIPC